MMKIWSNLLKGNSKDIIKYSFISKGFARNFKSIPKIVSTPDENIEHAGKNKPENMENLNVNKFKTPKIEQFDEQPTPKEEKKNTKYKKIEDIEGYLGNDEPEAQFSRKKDKRRNFDEDNFRQDKKPYKKQFNSEEGFENKRPMKRDRDWNRNPDERNSANRYENKRDNRDNRDNRENRENRDNRDNRDNRYSRDRSNNNGYDRFNKRGDQDNLDNTREFRGNKEFREDFRRGNRDRNDNNEGRFRDRNDNYEGRNKSSNFERSSRRNNEQFESYGSRNKSNFERRNNSMRSTKPERTFVNPDRNIMDSDEENQEFKPKNLNELKNRKKERHNPKEKNMKQNKIEEEEEVEEESEQEIEYQFEEEVVEKVTLKKESNKLNTHDEKTLNKESLNKDQISSDLKKESSEEHTPEKKEDNKEKNKEKQEETMTLKKKINEKEDETINFRFDYLYGSHAVEAALQNNYRKIHELYVLNSYKLNPNPTVQKLISIAESKNVKITYMTKNKIDKYSSFRPNNGVVMKCELRQYINLERFSEFKEKYQKKPQGNLVVLLDQISDPQSIGSIIRSSFFIGADNLLVNKKHSHHITSLIGKVSSGASESVDLFCLNNMKQFLIDARLDAWKIIMLGVEKDDFNEDKINSTNKEETGEVKNSDESDTIKSKFPETENIDLHNLKVNPEENILLLISSEKVVLNSLYKSVNFNVIIPPLLDSTNIGKAPFNLISSLNIGVSTGIILNHVKYLQKVGHIEEKKEINNNI